jgi:hypothetical protein
VILIKNDKLYDKLKFLAQVVLPALGTLYFALAGIWGLPDAERVVGTIVAVDTFFGVVLQLSSNAYAKTGEKYDGELHVGNVAPDGTQVYQLALKGDPAPEEVEELVKEKDQLIFKVNPPL